MQLQYVHGHDGVCSTCEEYLQMSYKMQSLTAPSRLTINTLPMLQKHLHKRLYAGADQACMAPLANTQIGWLMPIPKKKDCPEEDIRKIL
jgi:hypothetical protein